MKRPHGVLVAFGTLAQLVLEGRTEALRAATALVRELELTKPLSELDVDAETVEDVARAACSDDATMANEPRPVSPADAADALRTADELLAE